MKVVRSLDEGVWRRFVAGRPAGNIFHTPEMFQVFGQAQGHRPQLWAVTEADAVLALLLPVEVTLWGGPLRRLTRRAVAYGGVLCAEGERGQAALRTLLQAYNRSIRGRCLFTELRHLSDTGDCQAVLSACGFAYQAHLNYLVDLDRTPEAILQGMGRRTRKQIRRGLRRGRVIVEPVRRQQDVARCYDLLRLSYRRARVPLADRSLFEAAFRVLVPRKMARFLLARVGERAVAASVELLYQGVIYGWYGGMDRRYSRDTPTELLTWHILRWGAEHGYRLYDFGGAGEPDQSYGVRDFKAKFGGRLVGYGRNMRVHTPLYHLSRWGYQVYRRLRA